MNENQQHFYDFLCKKNIYIEIHKIKKKNKLSLIGSSWSKIFFFSDVIFEVHSLNDLLNENMNECSNIANKLSQDEQLFVFHLYVKKYDFSNYNGEIHSKFINNKFSLYYKDLNVLNAEVPENWLSDLKGCELDFMIQLFWEKENSFGDFCFKNKVKKNELIDDIYAARKYRVADYCSALVRMSVRRYLCLIDPNRHY